MMTLHYAVELNSTQSELASIRNLRQFSTVLQFDSVE